MEKSFEKFYSAGKQEKKNEKVAPTVEIPKEDWQTLETIAKRVGGDFGMEIKLGEPGKGSFFNPEDTSITLDPLYIKEKPEQAKFIAGHEGSHRAITPSPKEIGLSPDQIKKYYSQIGFGYLQNVIEDPAVNDWMRRRFPGLNKNTKEMYDEQLKEENAVLSTPEVQQIAARLGYWPKFSHYGSEVIRDWHQKKFSKKLDPAVEKALKRTVKLARESIEIIPDPDEQARDRKKIIETGRKRFENNTNYIWPEVKKLVEMDLHTEEQRQMLNDFRQKQKELEQKQQEMEQAKSEGDSQKADDLQKEIDGLKRELDDFNQMPEKARNELEEQIDKAIKEAAEQMNKEIENRQKQAEEAVQKQEELEKEIKDLERQSKGASSKEKENLKKQIEQKKGEKAEQAMKQKQAQKDLEDVLKNMEDMEDGNCGVPFPIDKLSEETKKEIEKLFKNLPSQKQKEARGKAEQALEDFEDALNKAMEGKLNEDNPENHKERKEKEKAERQAAQKSREAKEDTKRMERELERIRKEKMTPYEKARSEVLPLIDDLYYRLRKILKPEEYGGEELDWPSGKGLDITRAMQAEKDPNQWNKAWIRESAPEKKDYRFWHLVDLSGSMRGEKIQETFKGFIAVGEAIDRIENLNSDTLTVHQGVTGFHDRVFPFKDMNERLSKEIEDKLATMEERTNDSDAGTNTYAGTIKALEKLEQNLGESGNYLLTFSDGEPNSDIREKLKETLKQGKEKRKKLNIKVGLIWLGESEDEEKLQELVEEYGYDFGMVMPAVNPKSKEKEKNFAEKLADLMEDLVKEPDKY